ncbi:MAG: type I-E CRISPR-associated protein Cse1/CasA [Prevotellaceae bacterium]|nr:type I-E CRISPR-associated protein Cse1/CasA [Prevotellaceae bacterium]
MILGSYNLLDEKWISVIDKDGNPKNVSLKKVLEEANNFYDLAGDTKTQDFAVMRILLAVLHTVFSRFDYNGEQYEWVKLDDKLFEQDEEVDEYDKEEYQSALCDTWFELWKKGNFHQIVNVYLEKWRDSFYLFDDKQPFLQVVEDDISADKLNKPNPSELSGKNINRLVSESGNKIALFSPKNDKKSNSNKEILAPDEIARWLITLQGYIGLSDKVIFGNTKYKASKGWLFDIGGVYLKGDNLFETLMLNLALFYEGVDNCFNIQKPCWEMSSSELIEFYMYGGTFDNLAGLYTAWSRAVYINPNLDFDKPFKCSIVKLPEINHRDNFLEPMTLWKYNKTGENKDSFTPRKHIIHQSLWRSFSLLTMDDFSDNGAKQKIPGIIDFLKELKDKSRYYGLEKTNFVQSIVSVSMADDGNATSWVPIDEIIDYLPVQDFILVNFNNKNWSMWINDTIQKTKRVIEFTYKNYIKDIKAIRNINSDDFVSRKIEEIYFVIDNRFRRWLVSIDEEKPHEEQISEWEETLKKLVKEEAKNIFANGNNRDFIGFKKKQSTKKTEEKSEKEIYTIAHAYNKFIYFLNRDIKNMKEEGRE